MSLADKQAQLMAEFGSIKNAQERFALVVRRGRQYPGLSAEFRTQPHRLEGCLARVWLVEEFREGKCWFKTDSDSAIVKGIASILCEFYNGEVPGEILATSPSFLEKVGIDQHLTPNRRDSLGKIWTRISAFARSHTPE